MAIKKRTVVTVTILSVITLTAFLASAWFYASYKLTRLDYYKEFITKTVEEKYNRKITYETGKASLSLIEGLSLQFTNLAVTERDGSSDFLNVKNASLRVQVFPLLINHLVFREVILNEPRVSLIRDKAGVLNITDLLTKKEDATSPKFRKIVIEKGSASFLDEAESEQGILTSLKDFQCRINSPFWTKWSRFNIKTSVIEDKNKAELALNGFYHPAPSEKQFYESKVRAAVHLKGANIKHYLLYLKKYTPFEKMAGLVNADIKFFGKFSDFKSKGTIQVKNALVDYPGVFRDVLQPRMIQLNYVLKRNTDSLDLDVSRVAIDKFDAKGNLEIDDLDTKDPFLKAKAETSVFALREVRSYIPWGIIHKGVGNFIDEHIKDGNFRLTEGNLHGRLSQIAHMGKKESIDVLSIKAEVNKGIFEAAQTAPVFHDISGILELKRREFSLKNMQGRFGLSPMTMEGKISDFALPYPTIYTAEMKVQPARDEVLWLLGKEKFQTLSFKGSSTLVLLGKGTDEDYHINAQWDLTDASYAYPDVMEKPKARKNQLAAEIILSEDAVNFSSFNYDLPPVSITGSMMFRFAGGIPSSFNIKSKTFDVREVAVVLPFIRKYNPTGNCLLAVAGRGDLDDLGSIQWKGNASLTNVSLKPFADIKALRGLTGNIFFNENTMETSLFKAKMGESDLQGQFRIDDFHNPKVICNFYTRLLKTKDLGLQSSDGEVSFSDVKGQIAVTDNLIHADNLSFKLGESGFNLSGDITDFTLPKISLALNSPYVSSADFSRLISLSYPKKEGEASSAMELNAAVKIDSGKLGDIDFKKLDAGLKITQGIINVEKLEAVAFDGKFKAKGKVTISDGGKNHYDANIFLGRMSLEKIQNYLEIGNRTITGKLSLTGNISATGTNAEEIKKTAEGKFQVRAEKGILRKFSGLSKTFSLLNVLQLAKLRLPDMTTKGMAYNTITSTALLKDGVVSSEDFFIDSDSIQISGSGKIDYLKKKLDLIVGIHPLQTLDFVASKIPIAGWIITDEKGKLITVNFKIDGEWDNPNVTPINAKSIGKGTLNIFKRIFQLPEKLITDTGEVLFGH
ncbi:MAG: hypothetical protein APR62_13535 [Smithella sp. SDB]|nr:MAG: hypothetical protein APR62_13535 [Smithella sp. SDB]